MKWETAPVEGGEAPPGLSAEAVRDQLETLLSSDGFNKSPRMSDFLRFVVSETLAGRADRLKEYAIALEVFERDVTFDPKTNAVVRVEASRLRHRLREYFLGPGRDDDIHIEIPLGSYVPEFSIGAARDQRFGGAFPAANDEADTPLPLPDKPSIAVLPFVFLGDDAEQEYFADGIAEDLITALSRIRWLFVIARNSTFTYKGKPVKVPRVAEELGVRYVLEGSVRKSGARIRVSAQLIDAGTGNHIWANSYDRELADLFDLQDEIADAITASVEPEIGEAERERARRKPPDNLDAWECYQRGLWHMYQFDAADSAIAKELFARASALDPGFASPHGALAYVCFLDIILDISQSHTETIAQAIEAGRTAVALDDKDPMAHFGLGRALTIEGEIDAAINELQIAIELNPNFALAYLGLGTALRGAGRAREAVAPLDVAIRLSPHDPILWTMEHARAVVRVEIGEFERAVEDARQACRHPNTGFWSYLTLAAALGNHDRFEEGRAALDRLFAVKPDFSLALMPEVVLRYHRADYTNYNRGLRKLGMDIPDEPVAADRSAC